MFAINANGILTGLSSTCSSLLSPFSLFTASPTHLFFPKLHLLFPCLRWQMQFQRRPLHTMSTQLPRWSPQLSCATSKLSCGEQGIQRMTLHLVLQGLLIYFVPTVHALTDLSPCYDRRSSLTFL